MSEKRYTVKVTDNFIERLQSIENFLAKADAAFAYDDLLSELREVVIPNLRRFPKIGRHYLDHPPQSAEALVQLAKLPPSTADLLREYLHGDYLILYIDLQTTVHLLSIRHHRQLTF